MIAQVVTCLAVAILLFVGCGNEDESEEAQGSSRAELQVSTALADINLFCDQQTTQPGDTSLKLYGDMLDGVSKLEKWVPQMPDAIYDEKKDTTYRLALTDAADTLEGCDGESAAKLQSVLDKLPPPS